MVNLDKAVMVSIYGGNKKNGSRKYREVISELDRIIDLIYVDKSRLGFYPALYRKVTFI